MRLLGLVIVGIEIYRQGIDTRKLFGIVTKGKHCRVTRLQCLSFGYGYRHGSTIYLKAQVYPYAICKWCITYVFKRYGKSKWLTLLQRVFYRCRQVGCYSAFWQWIVQQSPIAKLVWCKCQAIQILVIHTQLHVWILSCIYTTDIKILLIGL